LEIHVNKADLIESVSADCGFTKQDARKAVDSVFQSIVDKVSAGETVTIVGFGTFSTSKRGARVGRNPKTGESLKIAASVAPKFKAGAAFRGAVGKKSGKKK
jgi:DNA-binding protein HU-beta